ncbi:MAG: beta-lactamase family protein [Phycisphaeraceae bacterium]|nr:beta-lactamase family protein [Phycisphaeraceae bacterium]
MACPVRYDPGPMTSDQQPHRTESPTRSESGMASPQRPKSPRAARMQERIATALEPFVAQGLVAGAVTLVTTADEVLSLGTIGWADIAARHPMEEDALFWIASQTKPITCTALMMLVDEGKVSVDDPIEKYLPEFKGMMVAVEQDDDHVLLRRPAHPPTVREALSHSSGLRFSSPVETPTLDRLPLDLAVRSHTLLPLLSEPGSRYQYSNSGTNTVGRIIEVVSGLPYEQFMQERLFTPLGMNDTTFWPSQAQCARIAKAYKPNADMTALEETPVTQLRYPLWDRTARFAMPAGGLFSTARDVARFCRMILTRGTLDGRRYVSEASVAQMTTKQTAAGVPEAYGFGWSVAEGACLHGGACFTEMKVDFTQGLVSVWLVQNCGLLPGAESSRPAFHQAVAQALASAG